MARKQGDKFSIDELKTLCKQKGNLFEAMVGNDYVMALSKLCNLKNKNDIPFTKEEIQKQPTIDEFNFSGKNDYKFICELKGVPMKINGNSVTNETIIPINFKDKNAENVFERTLGVSYILTCKVGQKEHIIKIGQTRTPFKARLQSYNCGSVVNWTTASTTNKKIKQSIVSSGLTYKLYLYECDEKPKKYTFHGVQSKEFSSPKLLAVEDIMVNEFIKQFKQKPLANIQANATAIN